jgi:ribosomal protein S18 acetylase RimI-like enzyme
MGDAHPAVRPMAADDWPAVQRLHKYAKEAGRVVFAYGPAMEAALRAAASRQLGAFGWVACRPGSGEVVGALTAQQEEPGEGGELVLLTVVVRADARGSRLGEQLVAALLQHAAEQGAARVVADVAAANERAWRFFQGQGFSRTGEQSDESFEIELELPPGGSGWAAAGGSSGRGQAAAVPAPAPALAAAAGGLCWRGGAAGGALRWHHGAPMPVLRCSSRGWGSGGLSGAGRRLPAAAGRPVAHAAAHAGVRHLRQLW